jgi:hypothetical protein
VANEVTPDARERLLEWLDQCDQDGWIVMVRWCVGKLVKDDQALLAEIVCREAERRAERANKERGPGCLSKHHPGDYIAGVLADCGLRLTTE